MLLPPSIDEYVGPTHRVRVIVEVVERLDLSAFETGGSKTGRGAFPPQVMVAVLLYAFSVGVFSSREIARRLETDCAFLFASSGTRPSYRTIARFRGDETEALAKVFAQVVVICREVGLGALDVVAIDGTRQRANASLEAHSRRDQLVKELERARAHVGRLLTEAARVDAEEDAAEETVEVPTDLADAKRRIEAIERAVATLDAADVTEANETDPDARIQRCKEGNRPGYNAQIAVAGDGLVVAADVTKDPGDTRQLLPLLDQITANVGEQPAVVVADAGYESGENVRGLLERGQDAVIASATARAAQKEKARTGRFPWTDFEHDPVCDEYKCPNGRGLAFVRADTHNGKPTRLYRSRSCAGCPFQRQCAPRGPRQLRVLETAPLLLAMSLRRKEDRLHGRFLARRAPMVEGRFGHFKHNLRWRRFISRGLADCRSEFRLLCAAYNVSKLTMDRLATKASREVEA